MKKKFLFLFILGVFIATNAYAGKDIWGTPSSTKFSQWNAVRTVQNMGGTWDIPWKDEIENDRKIPDGIYWAKASCHDSVCIVGAGTRNVEYNARKQGGTMFHLLPIQRN